MKKSAKGNIYEVTLDETWELFAPYLDGARAGVVGVASASPLGAEAREALENSAAALGYGHGSCTYAVLQPKKGTGYAASDGKESTAAEPAGKAEGRPADEEAAGDAALDGQALFLLLEGVDPLVVVAADAEAARALGAAYRQDVPLDGACRLFGRDAVAFKSFESMLGDVQSKQAAWALLKRLPKFGER